jgi:small-conductance mechanosensitive channel
VEYSQWSEALSSGLADLTARLADYLPRALGAVALVLGGWILAYLLSRLIGRLARHFDWLFGSKLVERMLERLGIRKPASEIVGSLVFWAVLLLFITAATETLGLPVIATWIAGLSYYLPRVLVSLLLLLGGVLAGNLAGNAVQRAAAAVGVAQAALLGRTVQVAILLVAVVTAVEQLGIDTDFLTTTITIFIGAIVGAAALAFGLGARTHVGNLIAAHYLRQAYRTGQTVRVAGVGGTLAEIGPTSAVIETEEGRVLVPAREFSEGVSVLVTTGA